MGPHGLLVTVDCVWLRTMNVTVLMTVETTATNRIVVCVYKNCWMLRPDAIHLQKGNEGTKVQTLGKYICDHMIVT